MISHTKIAPMGLEFTTAINAKTQMVVAGNQRNMFEEGTAQTGFFSM